MLEYVGYFIAGFCVGLAVGVIVNAAVDICITRWRQRNFWRDS